MKKNSPSDFRQLASMTPPAWHKDAIEDFGDKLASSMTLISSPVWQKFTQHHSPAWEPEPITDIQKHTAPIVIFSKKDLVDYAEKSMEYFQNYPCTSHLYALKSMGNLHSGQRKFTMGGIWSVF